MKSNNSSSPPLFQYSDLELVGWCSAYGILAALIISGNLIAIAVLTRKRMLSKRTSYFLLSLAVADMLVGCVSRSLKVLYLISGIFLKPSTLTSILRSSDVFCSLASTFTLTIIALERVFAITFPLQHRVTTKRVYHVLVFSVWVLSAVLSSFYFLYTYKILAHQVFFYFMMVTFFLSMIVMLLAYTAIWVKVRATLTWKGEKTTQTCMLTSDSFTDSKTAQEKTLMMQPKKSKEVALPRVECEKKKHQPENKENRTMIKASGSERSRKGGADNDRKLAVTLFIVTAVYIITWLPFQIVNMVVFFACSRVFPCSIMPAANVVYFCKLLNFSNSFINPVVYSLRLPDFRVALRKNILRRCIK
ncbi:predicted protein [Nematostella vectensis]|uniref:G-protein coupled receptors family 1 profile domain-containing protein n=2 Tax=Nematostella vectensis TaxID=45351 RepID=A7RRJ3_NEMVE|nr:predicted protein [Nematostella vectensis]|eukprot:XP_001638027.1 predicted protein [Nematostella vectensis]